MADSPELIHPIIQAMLANQEATQQGRALVERQRAAKEEEKLRRDQLSQAIKAHEDDLKIQQQHLDILHQTQQVELQGKALERQQMIAHLIGNLGVKPQDVLSQPSQAPNGNLNEVAQAGVQIPEAPQLTGQQSIPGTDVQFPAGTYQTQEDLFKKQLEQVGSFEGAKAKAQEEAVFPFKLKLQQDHNAFVAAQNRQALSGKLDIANLNNDTKEAIRKATDEANFRIALVRAAAGNREKFSPAELQTGVTQFLAGERDFKTDNPFDLAVTQAAEAQGAHRIDPKQVEALKQMQLLRPTFDALESYKNKYLSDSKPGAFVSGLAQSAAKTVGFTTDQKNELDQIKTNALNVAKNLEGLTGGRVTMQQMNLILDSLTGPNITKSQAEDKIQNLKDLFINKEQNTILGGLPEFQKKAIIERNGLKVDPSAAKSAAGQPDWLKLAPNVNAKGHKKDIEESIKYGRPVYVQ